MPEIKAKLEKFSLTIDLRELVNELPEEAKVEIAKLIGADDHAWRQMLEALVSDRFGTYNLTDEHGAWWFDSSTMLEIRKKLIPMLPEVARLAVEQALLERDRAKAYADQKLTETIEQDRAWYAMKSGEHYHWPDHWRRTPPEERKVFLKREAAGKMFEVLEKLTMGPIKAWLGHLMEEASGAGDQEAATQLLDLRALVDEGAQVVRRATEEPEDFHGLKLAPLPEPEEKQEEGVL
jgi:hypothetical protein